MIKNTFITKLTTLKMKDKDFSTLFRIIALAVLCIFSTITRGQNSSQKTNKFEVSENTKKEFLITAPEEGGVYIDGTFTGQKTPCTIEISKGEHTIGVGLENKRIYLRKKIQTEKLSDTIIRLTEKDKQSPSIWKALFVGVPEVYGKSITGECSTKFSQKDLDNAYDFFKYNLQEQIEPFSYGTVKWEIERKDLTKPVELTKKENGWYTLEANQGLEELENVKPGMYDTVFLFWREQEGDCSFKSTYFGLAWLDPSSLETRKTGYVTVKFNPGDIGVASTLDNYKKNDPGVWTHEWLHVVIEQFYPKRNVKVPFPSKNKLILHMAEAYGYRFPWMNWYEDLISGRVALGKTYTGIGPDTLLNCTVRNSALKKCED